MYPNFGRETRSSCFRTVFSLSIFCLALFLVSSLVAPSTFPKNAAVIPGESNSGARGYSPANAPSVASGACPSPVQKGAAKNIALGSGVQPTGEAYDPLNKYYT